MNPIKVLFVCVHNSARSQMAETFLNHYGEGLVVAESAGIEKGQLNPLAVEVMKEVGIDISQNQTNSVFEFYKSHKLYAYVIAVCDWETGQKCPIFPGVREMIHWPFKDPSNLEGSHESQLNQTRLIRNEIEAQVLDWIETLKKGQVG